MTSEYPTQEEMDAYIQEFWQDDTSEYDNLVELALDYLVKLVDSHKNLSDREIDKRLHNYVRGELEDYDVPAFFADRIVEHAKEKYLDL